MSQAKVNLAHKAAIDAIMKHMPGVQESKAFGYPAYKVNGKVFMFVGSNGASIKLPESRVIELIATEADCVPFQVDESIVWKSWLSISPKSPERYEELEPLFVEALTFVAEGRR